MRSRNTKGLSSSPRSDGLISRVMPPCPVPRVRRTLRRSAPSTRPESPLSMSFDSALPGDGRPVDRQDGPRRHRTEAARMNGTCSPAMHRAEPLCPRPAPRTTLAGTAQQRQRASYLREGNGRRRRGRQRSRCGYGRGARNICATHDRRGLDDATPRHALHRRGWRVSIAPVTPRAGRGPEGGRTLRDLLDNRENSLRARHPRGPADEPGRRGNTADGGSSVRPHDSRNTDKPHFRTSSS